MREELMSKHLRGRRWFALAAVVAPVTLGFVASGAAAPNPQAIDGATQVATSFVPRSLSQSDGMVVVQLNGKSVAQAQADAGRKLTGSEKNQVKARAKSGQDALVPRIQAEGGTILAQFQSALNGIKVQIAPSKLGQLAALPGVKAVLPVSEDVIDNAQSVPLIGA